MLADITSIPPIAKGWKIADGALPLLIIGSIIAIGLQKERQVQLSLLSWILANSIFQLLLAV